jgi:hypothetical protein
MLILDTDSVLPVILEDDPQQPQTARTRDVLHLGRQIDQLYRSLRVVRSLAGQNTPM